MRKSLERYLYTESSLLRSYLTRRKIRVQESLTSFQVSQWQYTRDVFISNMYIQSHSNYINFIRKFSQISHPCYRILSRA